MDLRRRHQEESDYLNVQTCVQQSWNAAKSPSFAKTREYPRARRSIYHTSATRSARPLALHYAVLPIKSATVWRANSLPSLRSLCALECSVGPLKDLIRNTSDVSLKRLFLQRVAYKTSKHDLRCRRIKRIITPSLLYILQLLRGKPLYVHSKRTCRVIVCDCPDPPGLFFLTVESCCCSIELTNGSIIVGHYLMCTVSNIPAYVCAISVRFILVVAF